MLTTATELAAESIDAFARSTRSIQLCDVAVDDLSVGSIVMTGSGARRPIRWLGHHTIDGKNHLAPKTVMPIRIAADAFGAGKPRRDLLVSPDQTICVDVVGDVLIPAAALVNGSTIARVAVDRITYWHAELDTPDILLAENLPVGSALVADRGLCSDDSAIVPTPDVPRLAQTDAGRPVVASGPLVDVIRGRLRERALAAGWTLVEGLMSDVHIVVDGTTIYPEIDDLRARFVLPADASDVWLVSNVGVPSHLGESADDRHLGLCLRALTIDDGLGVRHDVALDDPRLCAGFHRCETRSRRWTAGRARLPASLWEGSRGHFFLRVDLESAPLPRWVGPDALERQPAPTVQPMRMAR